jgi:hypothetical protein
MDKRTHLGMAGHYAAMSEFLYRGYNVAVPSVDIGDDVYVVEDESGAMWRLQVKTSDRPVTEQRAEDGTLTSVSGTYGLSRRQLRRAKANELFYMLVVRWESRWRFLLVPRRILSDLHDAYVSADRTGRRGRKPLSDQDATTDSLALIVEWFVNDARGWDQSLGGYLDQWPNTFPVRLTGPGTVKGGVPSPDLGTPPTPAPPTEPPTDPSAG